MGAVKSKFLCKSIGFDHVVAIGGLWVLMCISDWVILPIEYREEGDMNCQVSLA